MRFFLYSTFLVLSCCVMAYAEEINLHHCKLFESPKVGELTCNSACSFKMCQMKILCVEEGKESIHSLVCEASGDGSCPSIESCYADSASQFDRSSQLNRGESGHQTSTKGR